jgi:hypothetical protein
MAIALAPAAPSPLLADAGVELLARAAWPAVGSRALSKQPGVAGKHIRATGNFPNENGRNFRQSFPSPFLTDKRLTMPAVLSAQNGLQDTHAATRFQRLRGAGRQPVATQDSNRPALADPTLSAPHPTCRDTRPLASAASVRASSALTKTRSGADKRAANSFADAT